MTKLDLNALTKAVYRYFPYSMLQRGWDYYRKGHVYTIELDEHVIHAQVAGSGRKHYDVEVDTEELSKSDCSCPYDNYCKHMAAALFEAIELIGEDPLKLMNPGGSAWGTGGHSARAVSAQGASGGKPAAAAAVKSGKASKAIPAQAFPPPPGASAAAWQTYFESQVAPESYSSLQSVSRLYESVTQKLLPPGSKLEPSLRLLYELNVGLFVMKLADQVSAQSYRFLGYYYWEMIDVFHDIAEQCVRLFEKLIEPMLADRSWEQHSQWLEETANFLHQYAFPAQASYMPWNAVYTALWWQGILGQEDRVERERARLKRELRAEGLPPNKADVLLAALIMFDLRMNDDAQAMKRAEQFHTKSPQWFMPFLNSFALHGAWPRLEGWLIWLTPLVRHARQEWQESYFALWERMLPHRPSEEQWKEAVFQLMPSSLDYYGNHLLKGEQWQEWVDLHMTLGYTPLDFRASYIKPVENKSKELLLPWYHLSAEKLIAEKNRDSYKKAVKLIKKLELFYRKLKQQTVWETYHNYLTQKYSRLRAFQEELARGLRGGKAV